MNMASRFVFGIALINISFKMYPNGINIPLTGFHREGWRRQISPPRSRRFLFCFHFHSII